MNDRDTRIQSWIFDGEQFLAADPRVMDKLESIESRLDDIEELLTKIQRGW